MHSYKCQPVLLFHSIARKVYAQAGLWQLWRYLLRWQVYTPPPITFTCEERIP